jgi:hypothetical protein
MFAVLGYLFLIVLPFLSISKKYLFQTENNVPFRIFMDITIISNSNNMFFNGSAISVDTCLENENLEHLDNEMEILGKKNYTLDEFYDFFNKFDDFIDDITYELKLDKVILIVKVNKFNWTEHFLENDKLKVIDIVQYYGALHSDKSFIPEHKTSKELFTLIHQQYDKDNLEI